MTKLGLLLLAGLATPAVAAPFDEMPAIRAMRDEIARSTAKLELPDAPKLYFLSYELWDLQWVNVEASFGAIVQSQAYPQRSIDVELRVGDYAFDNSNAETGRFERQRSITLPIDDDYDALRHALWLGTDGAYKRAVETFDRKRAVAKAETQGTDTIASFSKEPATHIVDLTATTAPDRPALDALAKKLSAVFRTNPDASGATVSIMAASGHQYFVSSEGSGDAAPISFVKITVSCTTGSTDGMMLYSTLKLWAPSVRELPTEAAMIASAEELSREVSARRKAPTVDDYAGPILFTGLAASQIVRALLAEDLGGTPTPKSDRPAGGNVEETALVGKVGQRILPVGVSIVDDPTITRFGKIPLIGGYRFDEEGVPTQRVSLVENGTFKRFLMSRTPRKGFDRSNGHAFSSPFSGVRAHPSNLIVSAKAGLSDRALRKRALDAAKEQGLTYVLVIERLDETVPERDDFDSAMFMSPTVALPKPAVMKRLYLDGREELVRGGTISEVTLRSLRDIVAVGATPTVYHYLGSGLSRRYEMMFDTSSGYTVSIVAPPLLFRDGDIKKTSGSQRATPVMTRPTP